MKSFIAALRTLVLPFGATTGRRIVLDGINGQIILYDADNKERINIGRQDDTIELFSAATGEDDPGTLLAVVLNSASATRRGGTRITSPQFAATSNSESSVSCYSESFDGTIQPEIEYVADTHTFEASPPGVGTAIVLDSNGTISLPDSTADILLGNGAIEVEDGGDIRIANRSLPRGILPNGLYRVTASDVARAAGVNTNAFVTVTVDTTRQYAITLKTQATVGTTGLNPVELSEGGTIGANDGTIVDRFIRWQAADAPAGSLQPYVQSTLIYVPGSSGSKTLRVRNATGAAGTLQLTAGATNTTQLFIQDIGPA